MVTRKTARLNFNELLDIVSKALDMDFKEMEINGLHTEPLPLKRSSSTHEFLFSEEEKTGPHKPKEGH